MSLQIVLILLLATAVVGVAVLISGNYLVGLGMVAVPIFLFVTFVLGAEL